ncbi:MAG: glycosyltransferase family 39 protein [Bacteroidales bacterium]|nr:glycosyltransferase family 39 protein [Bacteroidales bacterium]
MSKEKKYLWLIVGASILLRGIFAACTELSNDEALYRILAIFPAMGYYAHPPMVALLARLTTLGASVAPEFFVRISSVIIGTVNTILVFKIATRLTGKEKTGLITTLLYTASVYATVFIGITLLPDSFLSLCWLCALDIMLTLARNPEIKNTGKGTVLMLTMGLAVGIGALSKYTAGYLAIAWFVYVLIYDRKWLGKWSLWGALLIAFAVFSPAIIWNLNHNFASIANQTNRLLSFEQILWWSPFREIGGNLAYQNPINWILIVVSIVFFLKNKERIERPVLRILLISSVPMILLFFLASFTQPTLPHWSAPAYFGLIILAALFLDQVKCGYKVAVWSCSVMAVLLILAGIEINHEPVPIPRDVNAADVGRDDITLDMYGWKQGGRAFAELYKKDVEEGVMRADSKVLNDVWFEGAHLDTYFALPLGLRQITFDNLDYQAISETRGGLTPGDDVYFISSSRTFVTPYESYSGGGNTIEEPETIEIMRGGRLVEKFYVYRIHIADSY